MADMSQGPLAGVRVLEFAGIGPVPFCGMLLSDMGAEVLRIDRAGTLYDRFSIETRGRRSVVLDLKSEPGRDAALKLMQTSEILIEGFRPGVMERLGLGPEPALQRNPALVYGRMTGFGQDGPLAPRAGHDVNYLALSGALHAIGTSENPVIPLNLIGDFGGGALYLATGVLAALLAARQSGQGQVVDCAMVDGCASLMSMIYGFFMRGQMQGKPSGPAANQALWVDQRASNLLDGGAHYYQCYRCADGEWIALGSIEPEFYARLLAQLGIQDPAFSAQDDRSAWPALRDQLAAHFATQPRAVWCERLEQIDVCFTPILSLSQAPQHPHNRARNTFVDLHGVLQPAPAPRFSATPSAIQHPPVAAGQDQNQALRDWGFSPAEISALASRDVVTARDGADHDD